MPLNKSAAIRYRIIDTCLNNKQRPFPTLEYLARVCSEKLDTDISTSTIEKDISAMKKPRPHGFDAHIIYDRERKGYAYGEPGFSISELSLEDREWESLRYAARLLYRYADIPVFRDFKQAIEKIDARFRLDLHADDNTTDNHIQFESGNTNTGYEWLQPVHEAIKNGWQTELVYVNIYKNETKAYQAQPYLLKENRNRWYMIAWVESRQDYLTFALDRIQDIKAIRKKNKRRADFNPDLFLQHSVGIMKNEGKPSKVVLQVKDPFDKLIRLEPIHASQKTIKTAKDHIQVEMSVYVNQEFCNLIMSMSCYCKVLQPAMLRSRIVEMTKDTLNQYGAAKK